MSLALISRNDDLRSLRDEGYEIDISNGYLMIGHVPYVNAQRRVAYGTLVSHLQLAGDTTVKQPDHVALWVGDHPCDSRGLQLVNLVNNSNLQEKIRDDLIARYSFSHKPGGGYKDYHEKMTTYIRILEGEAHALEPGSTSQTYPIVKSSDEDTPFWYVDTASSRAGIADINARLKMGRVAIIGLGGTGAYLLDLVAKTPVAEINLFDGDAFLQHNAFRSPGAPSLEDLSKRPTKVAWFAETYSKMRKGIVPHHEYIDEANVAALNAMNFVFLCLDKGGPKRIIVNYLVENKVPFIDVGMGLNVQEGTLDGLVRITSCTPSFNDHLTKRIPFNDGEDNEYSRNIQIADMNALNAALAVVKWKKMCGFYADLEKEHNTVYGISTNVLTNEEV